ncbi:hypothetical protein L7F22_036726 [Adiantum nelumboides]|nr:hypothetical protein [Adiantum nelumboides]
MGWRSLVVRVKFFLMRGSPRLSPPFLAFVISDNVMQVFRLFAVGFRSGRVLLEEICLRGADDCGTRSEAGAISKMAFLAYLEEVLFVVAKVMHLNGSRHRAAFQRGGPSSVKLEDSEPCKIMPCKTDSYLGDGLQKIELTESQLETMLTWKTHIEVSKQSLQEALEAACKLEMEAEKKCSTIISTHDWILSTIQNLQSEMLKTKLQKEIDKMQQDIIAATNELQSAKRDHERIAEKMRGSNEFMLNTNCLADSLYADGLRVIHPAPVEHPVRPASLFVSIEWCVFCGLGFGLQALDVVITPCLHTYHMFCATHRFFHSRKCVAQSCSEIMSMSGWLQWVLDLQLPKL